MTPVANPMHITGIDHIVIRVRNLSKMISFYEDVLGCKLERGPGDFGLAQMRAGHALIDLLDANSDFGKQGGDLPDHEAPNMDHICLRLQPWDEITILEHLKSHSVSHGPIGTRYGAKGQGPSLYLKDPEGNSIELKGQ